MPVNAELAESTQHADLKTLHRDSSEKLEGATFGGVYYKQPNKKKKPRKANLRITTL